MEMEYKDPSKRGRWIVVIGVVLAIAAGGAAFFLINQAQQQAGQGGLQKVAVVVALRPIQARIPIVAEDVTVREVPIDKTNAQGIISTPDKAIGHVLSVGVLQDQMITTNLFATETGGGFSILEPGETVGPDSEFWRAVALTVPDNLAVGGLIVPGMSVDVLMSATILVPQDLLDQGKYYSDKATKITYQNMIVLAKTGSTYIVKATLTQAEEIAHLQAAGNATFAMVMRPEADTRQVNAAAYGETTNKVIAKYGLPIPEVYPPGKGPIPTPAPTPTATPGSSGSPSPSGSPAPSTGP
jgi:Flp pilus assembly protein CpaB